MRLFVAIDVDTEDFTGEIEKIRGMVKCRAKFVDPKQMHLTVKFLGEVLPDRVEEIKTKLNELGGSGRLRIKLAGLGAFPSPGRPRVLWIGAESGKLPELAGRLESLLEDYSQETRGFHAHLTLARIKGPCDLKKLVRGYGDTKFLEFVADELVLKESILMPEGPVYHTIHRVTL